MTPANSPASNPARCSVHTGPKGGVEFRQWTDRGTFYIVSRYVAWPYLSPEDRDKANAMRDANNAKRHQRQRDAAAWRDITRGG